MSTAPLWTSSAMAAAMRASRNGALPDDLKKSPTAFYFRVHLSPGPKAAALCIAVGRQVSVANGKAIYSW